MKLSDKLLVVAKWLEDSDNDLLVNAETDEQLVIVAEALVNAASEIKKAADDVKMFEPEFEMTEEKLDEIAILAEQFDKSGDELLQKQASVLDEILLTFAAKKGFKSEFERNQDLRIEELKKHYQNPKKELDDLNKISDMKKDIENAKVYKTFRALESPLSARTCPDHPGVQLARIGEHLSKCVLDGKVYDYTAGYTTLKGNKVPGGDVSLQTPQSHDVGHAVFQTREQKLGLDSGNQDS
jgi:hypothetical protein